MSELELQATGTKVLVEVNVDFEETESGIKVPTDKKQDRGVIISIGYKVEDPALSVGKLAVFNEYGGKNYQEGSKHYILLNENEIYGTK
jgi:co-chaperonin GroES (HSP10)